MENKKIKIKSTTVLAVIHNNVMAIGADGQATMGSTIAKNNVKKIKKLANGKIIFGFAGSTADAFSLLDKFNEKLNKYSNNMKRSSIELAKEWRIDSHLKKLEAMMIVANNKEILTISGGGDVIEPNNDIASIGSGSMYAQSAAIALKKHNKNLSAEQIVKESLLIASEICIYTNDNIIIEKIS